MSRIIFTTKSFPSRRLDIPTDALARAHLPLTVSRSLLLLYYDENARKLRRPVIDDNRKLIFTAQSPKIVQN